MFQFLKIKTKIEYQIDEYIAEKALDSEYAAKIHKEVLLSFIKKFHYKNLADVVKEDIQTFYEETYTKFNKTKAMEAIRGFLRKFKDQHNINPKEITNQGIKHLQPVEKLANILPMKKRKPGRPANIAFIKQVRQLIDEGKLGMRATARALSKKKKVNPGTVYHAYHNPSVAKKLST